MSLTDKHSAYAYDPMPPLIVGLGHRRRVGKDTLARILRLLLTRRGLHVEIEAFADPLRHVANTLYGWAGMMDWRYYDDNPELREAVLDKLGKSPRQIWIDLGTKAVRDHVYDRTWVELLLNTPRYADVLLVPDVRFLNEVEAIRQRGGMCVLVTRDSVDVSSDVADEALRDWTGWDQRVRNNGTITELEDQAKKLADILAGTQ